MTGETQLAQAVEPFTGSMTKTYLDGVNLQYLVDSAGDYLVRFTPADDRPCEVEVWLLAEGTERNILNVQTRTSVRFAQDKLGDALLACNEWQKIKRWPKAYVLVDEATATSRIILEFQIPLEKGIHQELFSDVTGWMITTSLEFWKWAHIERQIY
jgi:Putative bacterial sensory transduction regulator